MSIPEGALVRIVDVWAQDAQNAFLQIHQLLPSFSTISIDTEFPGCRDLNPPRREPSEDEHKYHIVKAHVDNMFLIQVGLTLTNDHGELPMLDGAYTAWQFNLRDFDISKDWYFPDSIQLLINAGIDFERNRREGIGLYTLGSLFLQHGLVFNKRIRYICYQGDMDLAYLVKAISGDRLPSTNIRFRQVVRAFFGAVYDIRVVQLEHFGTDCGLQGFCDKLGVQRIRGAAHQAGSDSLLTASAYHTIKQRHLDRRQGSSDAQNPNPHV
ncbi:hypothetical protein L7F22_010824 [Adiantum nelumboides]|nr:hypothetical protein [Adiantum nelumboides]